MSYSISYSVDLFVLDFLAYSFAFSKFYSKISSLIVFSVFVCKELSCSSSITDCEPLGENPFFVAASAIVACLPKIPRVGNLF